MLPSLTSRIMALSGLVVVATIALILVIVDASSQSHDSFRRVSHSAEVIEATDDALLELREAESGQRGFVLTGKLVFARSVEARIAGSRRAMDRVVALTQDNPVQYYRAREMRTLANQRVQILQETLNLAKAGNFDEARANIGIGHGRELMEALVQRADGFLGEERAIRALRVKTSEERLQRIKRLALIGGPLITMLVLLVSALIIMGIRRPLGIIRGAMRGLGEGKRDAHINMDMGSR